jgi:hypothetical protein
MAHLTTLLICDAAQVRENLLMVLSGGITRLHVPELPATIQFSVAIVVEINYVEIDQPHEIRMTIIDPESAGPIAEPFVASLPADPETAKRIFLGEPVLVPLTVSVALGVEHAGQYDIRVTVDDAPAEIQSVWVVSGDQPGPEA